TPGRGITAAVGGETILVGNATWLADNGIDIGSSADDDSGAATRVFVARAGRYLGAIDLADKVRPEAKRAVADLHGGRLQEWNWVRFGIGTGVVALLYAWAGFRPEFLDFLPHWVPLMIAIMATAIF